MMSGWYGVDLDATLAFYDGWPQDGGIGEPIPMMATRVREWLQIGKEVRIFTARVAYDKDGEQLRLINLWSAKHFGVVLPVTCRKDSGMIELWDDRCVQVRPNTGEPILGETGRFPHGQLNPHDQGELRFAIAADPSENLVYVDFGKPVQSLALDYDTAINLSNAFRQKAEMLGAALNGESELPQSPTQGPGAGDSRRGTQL